jgi:N-acyl-D-aspartate/D-glutamate deacylase
MRLTMIALLLCAASLAAAEPEIVLRGGTIVDGTGSPGVVGDVHLQGDKIIGVGKVTPGADAKVFDCTGMIVCPGFIDLHTHCDSGLQTARGKANKNYITQGVTTAVTGNCGSGPVDVAKYFGVFEKNGVGTNVIHQVPHNNVREQVMGNANRSPTKDELAKMEALTEQAMKDGAWGLATGLIYNPGTYAKTDEIVALAKVAAKYKGHYASHIRNEGSGLLNAIQEAITIGKESGCPVHISHIKASGKAAAGMAGRAILLIESARRAGQTVTADQYPYIASSTSLRATIVPTRYREGSTKDYVARFDDPTTGPKMRSEIEASLKERDNGALIQIARYAPKPVWQGKRIADVAKTENKAPIDLVI